MFRINYVCFNITSKCNMTCPYCYRAGNTTGSVSLSQAKKYIDFLIQHGCDTINITGGEPLLNPAWKDIVKYCIEKGLFVIISTNGLLLDLDDEILNHINVLSLPLDGGSENVNSRTRSKGHFEKIHKLLEKYKSSDYPFKIKINTVLTRYNYDTLNDILLLLNDPKVVWKIFELREKGEFYNFPIENTISFQEANRCISLIDTLKHSCSIYYMGKHADNSQKYSVNPNYIVLNYNGDIYLATENEDKLLFNIDSGEPVEALSAKDMGALNNQYREELMKDFKRY